MPLMYKAIKFYECTGKGLVILSVLLEQVLAEQRTFELNFANG